MSIQSFIEETMSEWMKSEGEASDIVLSTRIRLARNDASFAFASVLDEREQLQLRQQLLALLQREFPALHVHAMDQMDSLFRHTLVEKHLISPALSNKSTGAVLLSKDETVSIMVNEEDHLRIQCLGAGLQLENVYEQANAIDDQIERNMTYAFHQQFGYLTSCPSNTGTGLRASVMMHLPVLSMTGQMKRIVQTISRLGFVVRGTYGEGSEASGNLYQISNQTTLGKSEQETIQELKDIAERLIAHERALRQKMIEHSRVALEDRIFRSYGTLRHSRLLQSKEAADRLSDIRLGIDLGLIQHIHRGILNELLLFMQPWLIQQYANRTLTPRERDQLRAKIFRQRLSDDE